MDLSGNHSFTVPQILTEGTPKQRTDYAIAMGLWEWANQHDKGLDYSVCIFQDILVYQVRKQFGDRPQAKWQAEEYDKRLLETEGHVKDYAFEVCTWIAINTTLFDRAFARFMRMHTKMLHPDRRYENWGWKDLSRHWIAIAHPHGKHIILAASDYAQATLDLLSHPSMSNNEVKEALNQLNEKYHMPRWVEFEGKFYHADFKYLFYDLKPPYKDGIDDSLECELYYSVAKGDTLMGIISS